MSELDPDQLLKSLDASIAMARHRRSSAWGSNRNTFRMAGIMALVIGTAISLLALQYMTSEMVGNRPAPSVQQAAGEPK